MPVSYIPANVFMPHLKTVHVQHVLIHAVTHLPLVFSDQFWFKTAVAIPRTLDLPRVVFAANRLALLAITPIGDAGHSLLCKVRRPPPLKAASTTPLSIGANNSDEGVLAYKPWIRLDCASSVKYAEVPTFDFFISQKYLQNDS